MNNKSLTFVLSAPSGAGKTTISNKITGHVPRLKHSISHTTRKARPNEVDGKDYFFISREEFEKKVARNEFIEWADVYGNLYGTSIENIQLAQKENCDLLFVIDVQGAETFRKLNHPGIFIFLLPPSLQELESRLRNRKVNTEEEIRRRLEVSRNEIFHYKSYDYVLVNNDLEEASDQVKSIIISERCRNSRFDPSQVDLDL